MGSVASLLLARLISAKKAIKTSGDRGRGDFSDLYFEGNINLSRKNFLGSIYGDLGESFFDRPWP